MNINPLSLVEDLINEHGSSTILRERLSLLKEILAKVEQERTDLVTKCSHLEKELSDLRKKFYEKNVSEEFTEYMGALFKRDSSGKYAPVAHCRRCKEPLWNTQPEIFPYQCSTPGCSYTIMLHGNLTSIADKLTSENS